MQMIRSIFKMLSSRKRQASDTWQVSDPPVRSHPLHTRYSGDQTGILNCCIAYNDYGGYCVPLSVLDRPAVQMILAGEIYEPDTISFMREHCGTGDIVHAGTFFGDFLPALSQACHSEARIWAFEPNPESYRCAKATLEINGVTNVVMSNLGLGSESNRLHFQVLDESGVSLGGASRFIETSEEAGVNSVEVGVERIDDIIPSSREIRILQLDVEGFEEQALIGATQTIRRCRPIVILEALENNISQDWFATHFPELKYELLTKLHHNTVFVSNSESSS